MEKLRIHATKRTLHRLVKDKLSQAAPTLALRPCRHCRFSSLPQRFKGYRSYFLYWDRYSAYLTQWLGQGQLRISSPDTGVTDIVINIPMEELTQRGMTKFYDV